MKEQQPKAFIVDQVSWHTEKKGSLETPEEIYTRFRALFGFLRSNNLLVPGTESPPELEDLPSDFHLRSEQLTETGLQVLRAGYYKWLSALEKGTPPTKITILENALRKVQASNA